MLDWLKDLPAEIGFGLATAGVLAALGWMRRRFKGKRLPRKAAIPLIGAISVVLACAIAIVVLDDHEPNPQLTLGMAVVTDTPAAFMPAQDTVLLSVDDDTRFFKLAASSLIRDVQPDGFRLRLRLTRAPNSQHSFTGTLGDPRSAAETERWTGAAGLISRTEEDVGIDLHGAFYGVVKRRGEGKWERPFRLKDVQVDAGESAFSVDIRESALDGHVEAGDDLRIATDAAVYRYADRPDVLVDAMVRRVGELVWREENRVEPPATLEYQVRVSNISGRELRDLVVRDSLPPVSSAAYLPDSARYLTSATGPRGKQASDDVVNGGLLFNRVAPDAVLYALIRVRAIPREEGGWFTNVWHVKYEGASATQYAATKTRVVPSGGTTE